VVDGTREAIMTERFSTALPLCIGMVVLGLAAGPLLSGCGCSYGTATEVTVAPDPGCIEVGAAGLCSRIELSGVNHCEDILTFIPLDESPLIEVYPEVSFEIGDVPSYADMETDDEYCSTDVTIDALLGDEDITFTFAVERINRGLRLPCD